MSAYQVPENLTDGNEKTLYCQIRSNAQSLYHSHCTILQTIRTKPRLVGSRSHHLQGILTRLLWYG